MGVKFISGKDNYVDILTKPLPRPSFLFFNGKLLANSASRLRGDVENKAQSQSKSQPTVKLKLLPNSTPTAS